MAANSNQTPLDRALSLIADVPDYPKPGILFKDITPLLADGPGFGVVIDEFARSIRSLNRGIDAIVGIESRGFILGGAIAKALEIGFVTVRKPGKLPRDVYRKEYALEYGFDALELHKDLLGKDDNVIIVDDVLATGGTAMACHDLVDITGAKVVAHLFMLEIEFLRGRSIINEQHPDVSIISLLKA